MAKKKNYEGVEVSYRKGEYFYERLHVLSNRANELLILVNSGKYEYTRALFAITETLYGHVRYYIGKKVFKEGFENVYKCLLTQRVNSKEYRVTARKLVELFYDLEDEINRRQLNIPYESVPDDETLKEKAKRRFR